MLSRDRKARSASAQPVENRLTSKSASSTKQDRPLPFGQEGEVVVRGDLVMQGYWNNPTATGENIAERLVIYRRHRRF
jgi:long-subunit acyl-CoA synthetase (AMP-forming)